MRRELPPRFLGYSTNFTEPDPADGGTQLMQTTESGPVNHLVETLTISAFFRSYLNFDVGGAIGPADWADLSPAEAAHDQRRGDLP